MGIKKVKWTFLELENTPKDTKKLEDKNAEERENSDELYNNYIYLFILY